MDATSFKLKPRPMCVESDLPDRESALAPPVATASEPREGHQAFSLDFFDASEVRAAFVAPREPSLTCRAPA